MKIVLVPNDIKAMHRLDMDATADGDLVEYRMTQNEFDILWNIGYFDALNSSLNLSIDEFEDEKIDISGIDKAMVISNSYMEDHPVASRCLTSIVELLELARKKRTGLFMYF